MRYDTIQINHSPLCLGEETSFDGMADVESIEIWEDFWATALMGQQLKELIHGIRYGHFPVKMLPYIRRIFYRDGSVMDYRFGYEGVEVH